MANLSAILYYIFTYFMYYAICPCKLDAVCIIINITGEPTNLHVVLPKVLLCGLNNICILTQHLYSTILQNEIWVGTMPIHQKVP